MHRSQPSPRMSGIVYRRQTCSLTTCIRLALCLSGFIWHTLRELPVKPPRLAVDASLQSMRTGTGILKGAETAQHSIWQRLTLVVRTAIPNTYLMCAFCLHDRAVTFQLLLDCVQRRFGSIELNFILSVLHNDRPTTDAGQPLPWVLQ